MADQRVAWGQTLFCDDIRYEMGGKRSLIGVYQDELILSGEFPATIGRLVLFIIYDELKGALTDKLYLHIYMPEDDRIPSTSLEFPRPNIAQTVEQSLDGDEERIIRLEVPLVISAVEIPCEGDIKVRMVCGDVTTRLGRLHVRRYRDDEAGMFEPISLML